MSWCAPISYVSQTQVFEIKLNQIYGVVQGLLFSFPGSIKKSGLEPVQNPTVEPYSKEHKKEKTKKGKEKRNGSKEPNKEREERREKEQGRKGEREREMGCISSKLVCKADLDFDSEKKKNNSKVQIHYDHVVSLKSTTYGVLNLDHKQDLQKEEEKKEPIEETKETEKRAVPILVLPPNKKKINSKDGETEVINAWEIMEGLEDNSIWSPLKKSNKLNLWSPKKLNRKKPAGKENSPLQRSSTPNGNFDSNRVLRPFNSVPNSKLGAPNFTTPSNLKKNQDGNTSSSRRSLVPLFDPDLIASIEKEFHQEKEQIKQIVTQTPKSREADKLLKNFQQKCPPGGATSLVLYTTTLRGIRKTFEECNSVRSLIESHGVQIMERDISMDSGYKEELRLLLEKIGVKVPMLFVKGRLIGGAEEVIKLEEEGKLGKILRLIPKAKNCEGCCGVRFVMCKVCNGSCKVLDQNEKSSFEKGVKGKMGLEKGQKSKMMKCGECNENGLVKCPICC
ncbi:hypothetical protein LUZ60_004150 [Juncus effusus]|nr:hypothetical protein LUZ60_004150 [Juncus effusus]